MFINVNNTCSLYRNVCRFQDLFLCRVGIECPQTGSTVISLHYKYTVIHSEVYVSVCVCVYILIYAYMHSGKIIIVQ